MQLNKTVDMMLSDDYTERFKAEYHQVVNRANKLRKMLKDWSDGTLAKDKDFEPTCPYYLLKWQLRTMEDYIYVLKIRAEIEGISLK